MNTPETETPICKHCGEYEHDCKCAASREIANLMRELQEAKDKSNAFEMALEERNEHCADAKEKVRTLERENAQLRKELGQLKGKWHQVSDERDQLKSKLFRVEYLAQTNWKMAEEFADAVKANGIFHTPIALRKNGGSWDDYQADAINRSRDALSRFQTQKAKQPK